MTLGDVSGALLYLHGLKMCHLNLKLTNILLLSNSKDPRGFVAKVKWGVIFCS